MLEYMPQTKPRRKSPSGCFPGMFNFQFTTISISNFCKHQRGMFDGRFVIKDVLNFLINKYFLNAILKILDFKINIIIIECFYIASFNKLL